MQYASAAGVVFSKTDLSSSIPAHGFYLIQEAAGAAGTVAPPTPDTIGTIPMSATFGVIDTITMLPTSLLGFRKQRIVLV